MTDAGGLVPGAPIAGGPVAGAAGGPVASSRVGLRRWVGVATAARGRSHEARGIGCEDVVALREGPVFVAALADGAGSARHARLGAQTVVHAVVELLARELDALCALGPEGARARILASLDAALAREATRFGAAPRDLSSTLLFFAAHGARILGGQLGDGVLAVRKRGRFDVVFEPAVGEFAGQTVFVPTRRSPGELRLFVADAAKVEGVALMSDGAAASLAVPSAEGYRVAPALDRWWQGLGTHGPAGVRAAVHEGVHAHVRARTGDDCALALARTIDLHDESARAWLGAGRVRRRVARAASREQDPFGDDSLGAIARRARVPTHRVGTHLRALDEDGWFRAR